DDKGQVLPTGETGEAQIRAAGTMSGYWGATSSSTKFTSDNWIKSGDVGRIDSDGYIFVLGRLEEQLTLPERTVYPSVIEDLLYQDPSISEVIVAGVTAKDQVDDSSQRNLQVLIYPQHQADKAAIAERAQLVLEGAQLEAQVYFV